MELSEKEKTLIRDMVREAVHEEILRTVSRDEIRAEVDRTIDGLVKGRVATLLVDANLQGFIQKAVESWLNAAMLERDGWGGFKQGSDRPTVVALIRDAAMAEVRQFVHERVVIQPRERVEE